MTRPTKVAWLVMGTISSVTFVTLSLLSARQGIFDLDHAVDALVDLTRGPSLRIVMEDVSLLGQASALAPLIVLVSLVLWRVHPRWAVAFPLVMAGTGALQLIGKWSVDRPRPNGAAWGFPSGHALTVLVFFGVIAYLLWTSRMRRRWRWTGAVVCVLVVLTVGWSRLYLQMHWLSDVGGGFAIGLAYLPLTIWLVEPARPRHRRLDEGDRTVVSPGV